MIFSASLYEFGKDWLLEFEPTKSQELIITNSVADNEVTHPPLSMGGVIVEEKEQLEVLGFTIDPREVADPCMQRQLPRRPGRGLVP